MALTGLFTWQRLKQNPLAPGLVMMAVAELCFWALVAAYVAEYVFGLLPCILCILQRIPFFLVVMMGLLNFYPVMKHKSFETGPSALLAMFSGIALLVNSVIALYHSGVELKWWRSHLEGCSAEDLAKMSPEEALAALQSRPAVPCDEIPWADPVLGLSMANYNVLLCGGLGLLCLLSVFMHQRKSRHLKGQAA